MPGQTATIFFQLKDINGVRTDDGYVPVITQVITPAFITCGTYPQNMIELDTGLYYFQFVIPNGVSSIGSYLIDVAYLSPIDGYINNEIFQLVINSPYGNFSTTTF
jgi:hypothetical protein